MRTRRNHVIPARPPKPRTFAGRLYVFGPQVVVFSPLSEDCLCTFPAHTVGGLSRPGSSGSWTGILSPGDSS